MNFRWIIKWWMWYETIKIDMHLGSNVDALSTGERPTADTEIQQFL